jgi:hypothetical protein
MKHLPFLSALLFSALPAHRPINRPRASSEELRRVKSKEDRRALLGGIFALTALATCCYLIVKDPPAWREPSCLPEHRCDAL